MSWMDAALLGLVGVSAGAAGLPGALCIGCVVVDWWRDHRATRDRLDHIAQCEEFEGRGGYSVDWDAEFADLLKAAGR